MLIPESMKKDALRRVRQEIEKEILEKLSIDISVDSTYDGSPGIRVSVGLNYNGKTVSEGSEHVYL